MKNEHLGDSWSDLRKELFTPEEIAACDLKVAVINEIIKAREENGLSQRQLEKISGVKQPVIARMEKARPPRSSRPSCVSSPRSARP